MASYHISVYMYYDTQDGQCLSHSDLNLRDNGCAT